MSEIRVLFASLPAMLSDIIREAVDSEPDLRIADERGTLDGLAEAVQRARPRVLVVGSEGGVLPGECLQVMFDPPHPNTLTVSLDGTLTSAYRLLPHAIVRENGSTSDLIAAIRELNRPSVELPD